MKRYFKLSMIAIFAVLVTAGYVALNRGRAETISRPVVQETESDMRTVQVAGTGEVRVQPDSAVINLGVQTEANTAEDVLKENNTRMQSLLETLEDAGIPSSDIQTQTINLSPRYEFDNETRTLIGYMASNIVQVQVDDLDSLGTLIDEAVSDGANTVDSISFEISNPQNAADQARQEAFENARHKAEELADLADAGLGVVLAIEETSITPGPLARSFEVVEQAAAVPVAPGRQVVRVEVKVTWTLRNADGQ